MFSSDSILGRVLVAIVVGIITGLVVALVLFLLSALLPGVTIDASFWGTVLGILAALVYFFTGKRAV